MDAWKCLHPEHPCKYLVYGGAAGGGKTWLGVMWLFVMCTQYPGTRYFVGRRQLKDIKQSIVVTMNKFVRSLRLDPKNYFKLSSASGSMHFHNGSEVVALDLRYMPSDPFYERYGSLEFTSGWIEEAGEVNEMAYEMLKSRLGRYLNDQIEYPAKLLLTTNPKKNWVYREYYKPWREGSITEELAFIQSFVQDNDFIEGDYKDRLENIKVKSMKQRLLLGNWEYDDDEGTLMDYDSIVDMFTNEYVDNGERYISADIALEGSDKFVAMVWSGFRVEAIHVWDKTTGPQAVENIKRISTQHRVPRSNIVFDSDGVGNFLKGFLGNSVSFRNNAPPLPIHSKLKEDYRNLKSQCFFKLAELINANEVYCTNTRYTPILMEELSIIRNDTLGSDRKLSVQPKEQMKMDLGRSPDFAESMMMRMYFELKPAPTFKYSGHK